MSVLVKLTNVTDQLTQLLNQMVTSQNRDEVMESVQALIEQRELLFRELVPPFSAEDMELGEQLFQKDQAIQLRLSHLFLELKNEMKSTQKQKSSNKQYLDPYRQLSTNYGSYWDKKN
ncbi:flagellar protein FliT [Amphibacillus marinus]|uniref:Flagellar protein FliT n=1 Tax=Amphibacillus marinus TaxID=872970 RepID=A0A1H8QDL4_9BACI|nr:flagellar protein FliT [Amphibacillus marinus]SEO52325.1 flagellar protein FliT [Amphibacillus marinus]